MSALDAAARTARAIEAVENYSRADAPYGRVPADPHEGQHAHQPREKFCVTDDDFWTAVTEFRDQDADHGWRRRYRIYSSYLTGWVARVPGLFWTSGAVAQRALAEVFVESRSAEWLTFTPVGKSHKVAGGIGTLRLPPDSHGFHLATLTCGANASSGIPVLVSTELWDRAAQGGPAEGRHIESATGRWQQMGHGWSDRFEGIKGVPQGYLVIDHWDVGSGHGPVEFHPFSVMEYENEQSKLFDFVYATADLGDKNWRGGIEAFFENYRTRHGRSGHYLTAADTAEQLWEADFNSPKELRQKNKSGRTNLDLLTARIQERLAGRDVTESTMTRLGQVCDEVQDLLLYSDAIGIRRATWLSDGALAENINLFVAQVQRQPGKMEELIHRLDVAYPQAH